MSVIGSQLEWQLRISHERQQNMFLVQHRLNPEVVISDRDALLITHFDELPTFPQKRLVFILWALTSRLDKCTYCSAMALLTVSFDTIQSDTIISSLTTSGVAINALLYWTGKTVVGAVARGAGGQYPVWGLSLGNMRCVMMDAGWWRRTHASGSIPHPCGMQKWKVEGSFHCRHAGSHVECADTRLCRIHWHIRTLLNSWCWHWCLHRHCHCDSCWRCGLMCETLDAQHGRTYCVPFGSVPLSNGPDFCTESVFPSWGLLSVHMSSILRDWVGWIPRLFGLYCPQSPLAGCHLLNLYLHIVHWHIRPRPMSCKAIHNELKFMVFNKVIHVACQQIHCAAFTKRFYVTFCTSPTLWTLHTLVLVHT